MMVKICRSLSVSPPSVPSVIIVGASLHAAAHAHPVVVVAAALRIVHLRVAAVDRRLRRSSRLSKPVDCPPARRPPDPPSVPVRVRPSLAPSAFVPLSLRPRPSVPPRCEGEGSIGIAVHSHVGPTTHPIIPAAGPLHTESIKIL